MLEAEGSKQYRHWGGVGRPPKESRNLMRTARLYSGGQEAQRVPRRPEVVRVYRGSRAEKEDSTVACVSVGYQNGRQEGRASGGWGGGCTESS